VSEAADVLSAISSSQAGGKKMALATIVAVTGSTYRRPGARLLVPEDGETVGNLSGGCLEGEVEQVARAVMEDGEPRVAFYDLTADDEVVWGWGLGCNGAIEVFVEPADKAAEVAGALELAIREERPLAVATVLDSDVAGINRGGRILVHADGRTEGGLGDGPVDDALVRLCSEALRSGASAAHALDVEGGRIRVFVESITPPPRLLVCGAGHDAIPLVAQASSLGWRVAVVDDRAGFLTPERFPGAAEFVEAEPVAAAHAAAADDHTYAVVMSHNYLRDRDYLKSFLASPVAYIGMLGPRARLERLLDDLSSDGIAVSQTDLERVHGPAGLDLGGEGPEEIAAAIVAEILAVSRGRGAGFLRERSGSIHERPAAGLSR
jgi:xanthine dehydrogenase accessory factor